MTEGGKDVQQKSGDVMPSLRSLGRKAKYCKYVFTEDIAGNMHLQREYPG